MQIKGEQFVINQKCHRQDLFVDTSLSWLNMILNYFLCLNVNILLCSMLMCHVMVMWLPQMLHWVNRYVNRYAVPHPPFSLLLMVPVVLPVGGLPGGLDEHASQGPASATCRQHAVMSQDYLLQMALPAKYLHVYLHIYYLLTYISTLHYTICMYLLALRCLCGGFHGSMPPQNHVGSSMIILFIWN